MSDVKSSEHHSQADIWSNFAAKYEKTIGVTTRIIAKHLLQRSPPFSKESVVLDNACGTGIATEEVQEHLRSQADLSVKVYAADIAPQMIQVLKSKAEKAKHDENWPNTAEIRTYVVPAEQLDSTKVPSEVVSHAYMNFGIFFSPDPLEAARNVYRALAPGGTAFFTTWADLGYENVTRKTEKICNPGNENFALTFSDDWKNPDYIVSLLREAGFSQTSLEIHQEPSRFRTKNTDELVDLLTELVAPWIRDQVGFEDDGEKALWKKTLAENIANDDHFVQEADSVAIKMVANVAKCVK